MILSISAKDKDQIDEISDKITSIRNYYEAAKPVVESKILMDILRESSLRDGLTGLYNRRFLEEYIEQEQAHIQREKTNYDIMMIDIDYFKLVNDTYGHDVGDMVIKALSEILQSSIRESDMAIRYGGEEFGVILVDTAADDAVVFTERLRKRIEAEVVEYEEFKIKFTVSLGISELTEDCEDYKVWLEQSDKALYVCKESGRNQSNVFSSS